MHDSIEAEHGIEKKNIPKLETYHLIRALHTLIASSSSAFQFSPPPSLSLSLYLCLSVCTSLPSLSVVLPGFILHSYDLIECSNILIHNRFLILKRKKKHSLPPFQSHTFCEIFCESFENSFLGSLKLPSECESPID